MATLTEYKITLEDLIDRTLLLLFDPLGEKYTRARIARALNDRILDFVLKAQMIKDEINIQLKENSWDYDIQTRINEDGTVKGFGFILRIGFNGNDDPGMWPTDLVMIDLRGYSRDEKRANTHFYLDPVSPGHVAIFGHPTEDGEALPSEENNMQVTYAAFPDYMDDEADYPDSDIPAIYHDGFPKGAAAKMLEEGNEEDLKMADIFEWEFQQIARAAVGEEYRGRTVYMDMRPM